MVWQLGDNITHLLRPHYPDLPIGVSEHIKHVSLDGGVLVQSELPVLGGYPWEEPVPDGPSWNRISQFT